MNIVSSSFAIILLFICYCQGCTAETEELYKLHRHKVNDAVYEVQKNLVSSWFKHVAQRSSYQKRHSLAICLVGWKRETGTKHRREFEVDTHHSGGRLEITLAFKIAPSFGCFRTALRFGMAWGECLLGHRQNDWEEQGAQWKWLCGLNLLFYWFVVLQSQLQLQISVMYWQDRHPFR